ncbi:MAG: aspartate kinase, partial [Bacteroidales bacterium]|nr:aspartate kinase [Bacteroidales bacterium]
MKVLKFGGTSVGSSQSLANVKKISESQDSSVIVVVSALSGVTDSLLEVSRMAELSDPACKDVFAQIKAHHYDLVDELFPDKDRHDDVTARLEPLFSELSDLLKGISLLHILTKRTSDQVVSFGERLSSVIVTELIDKAELYDALALIKTMPRNHKDVPDFQATGKLLKEAFRDFRGKGKIAVVPGFIATDSASGIITNLGRGGSDYTASIIASELDADCLEIWTDVDGFMTADPRIIKTSYVINELSYQEAMELCNFGAKVIYPPTLFPVRAKNIPIKVKNTFNPEAPGTVIKEVCERRQDRPVTGISSISDTCLITLSGNSMVGIVGVDGRIFSRLASYSISVFLICQSSSETGISIGVGASDAPLACRILNEEFEHEIATGEINPISADYGLATIAIVGDGMRNNAGLAGKLFSTLGRNGISVIACAQGKDETNISFVVDGKYLRKSINVIHDGFFLSEYQELNLFICGIGTVGGKLIEQIAAQQQRLKDKRNLKLNIVGIARSTKAVFDRSGIDLSNYRDLLEKGISLRSVEHLRDEVIAMNIFNSVFVDCTASEAVASIYKDLFMHGVSVVAANKVAASSDYSNYRCLKST